MAIVLQILKWVGVLINIALVVFLVRLYYQHIDRALWKRVHERYGESSASSVSMLVLLVVLFVAGTVLQGGLMEWSSQGLPGSGLIVWLAECVALPLKMLHYIVELLTQEDRNDECKSIQRANGFIIWRPRIFGRWDGW